MNKPNILWYLATITTLWQLYVVAYAFQSPNTNNSDIGDSNRSVNEVNSSQSTQYDPEEAQWSAITEKMWYAWRTTAFVSTLVLQLDIALMTKIEHTMLRCVAIVPVLFSIASAASAMLFITFYKNMKYGGKRERWIKAFENPRETCSIGFLTTLSLPLTFLVWSMLLSLAGIIIFTYVSPGQLSHSSGDVGICAGVIMTTAILVFAGLCRVVKLVK